jgi:uncharacterized protein YbbC (DUF1343 family)
MRRCAQFLIFILSGVLFLQSAEKAPKVMNGIDVLRERNFDLLAGKRIGLITNHTGLSADGTRTIDLLYHSKTCRLAALFSPEHGIRGKMDDRVGSSADDTTGLPIYSLYGEVRRPSQDVLKMIDALVFDIQDIGARFYTYITTMGYCMEEAAKANIPFIVLDRPNPIGGIHVEGPMLDADKLSFTGYMPLPVRHGMTVGELARYFNEKKRIGAQLQVVKMKGWQRSYYFWDTGQLWVDPSPNMRTIMAAILYPGVCLLEQTNVSVGRGTDRPFEIVGAPWIEPRRFAALLGEARISGVRFIPLFFTPNAGKYQGVQCGGLSFLITNANKLNSVRLGFALISALNKLYPKEFEIDKVMDLLGNADIMKQLKAGRLPAEENWSNNANFQKFLDKRRKVLIYDLESNHREGR